jgi:hypothetical protein
MDALSVAAAIVGLIDIVKRVIPAVRSVDNFSDITRELERIVLLLHLHNELLTKVGELGRDDLLQEQRLALEGTSRALQQVEAKLFPKNKRFNRILSKGPWQRDRAWINETLQQNIRVLELTLLQYVPSILSLKGHQYCRIVQTQREYSNNSYGT